MISVGVVGTLLRQLTVDTTRDYQTSDAPKGPTRLEKKCLEPN